MTEKRPLSEMQLVPAKKQKSGVLVATKYGVVSSKENEVRRTSSLHAPIMLLSGHGGEIYTLDFHPDGQFLASAGFDRHILLWATHEECENFACLRGHSGAVTQLVFSPGGDQLYSCSTDKTVAVWDVASGLRVRKLKGHAAFVNAVAAARRGPPLLCSAGDDSTVRLWDARRRGFTATLQNTYQVLCVTFDDTAQQLMAAGLDNDIKVWDVRQNSVLYSMKGHTDTVTGITLSADGSHLLSNAMDNTLRIWDVRAYAPTERCVKVLSGHQHNFEKNLLRCRWSSDGRRVTAGSADRHVYVWDTASRRILYKLPGHKGSVNDVTFHPQEPILASASSDKQIYLGELE